MAIPIVVVVGCFFPQVLL